jgi:hypothetical protein
MKVWGLSKKAARYREASKPTRDAIAMGGDR